MSAGIQDISRNVLELPFEERRRTNAATEVAPVIAVVVAKVAAPSLLQALQTMLGAQGPMRSAPTLDYGMPTPPRLVQPTRHSVPQEARRPSVVRPPALTSFVFGGLSAQPPPPTPALPAGPPVEVNPSSMIARAAAVRQLANATATPVPLEVSGGTVALVAFDPAPQAPPQQPGPPLLVPNDGHVQE